MPDFLPLQLLLATIGGWVNRHQAHAIEYLIEENRVLREQLDGRRLRLTDDQRRRLAAKGKRLGRPLLHRAATIVTADTILRFLILDRDKKFTGQFHRILEGAGVTPVQTSYQAPDMNAIAERFVGSIKRECLDRVILLGEDHLRHALREYVAHYNAERPHQGIGNKPIAPSTPSAAQSGAIFEHERLRGLLRSYSRVA